MNDKTTDKISGFLCWIMFTVLMAALVYCLCAITGCAATIPAGTKADSAIGRIEARADVIERTTKEPISKTQAIAIKADAKDAGKSIAELSNQLRDEQERDQKFRSRISIQIAVWVVRAWYVVLAGYIVLGLLGAWIAPGIFGRLILTNIFAPFAWLARRVGRQS